MSVDDWIPYLTSLRVIIFPRVWGCINKFVDALFRDPHICPALTTITSLEYPASWISLCNSLEIRNHLSMRDRSVQAIHTLNFPSSVHRNISGPLQVALSGGSPPLSSPSRFSYGRSTSSTLRASHMRDPPRLYATAAIVAEILSNVKEGKHGTMEIALSTRVKESLLVLTEEILQPIWSGNRWRR